MYVGVICANKKASFKLAFLRLSNWA